jgi:hypothetical protein
MSIGASAISLRRVVGVHDSSRSGKLGIARSGSGWRQRNPEGGVAVCVGMATDVTGAAGGVVVVVVGPSVIPGPDSMVPVPARSLATTTPTAPTATTALAPMTADNNLTLFC